MDTYKSGGNDRRYNEMPVIYSKFNTKGFCEAKAYDAREEGICLESEHALLPGTPIYIKMTPDNHASELHNVYIGEVRQSKSVRNNCAYRADVQYMARGRICNGRNLHKSEQLSCDLCEKKTSWQEVHETDDSLYLCPDCFRHLGKLIDGKIKECVTRFMSGNVM